MFNTLEEVAASLISPKSISSNTSIIFGNGIISACSQMVGIAFLRKHKFII